MNNVVNMVNYYIKHKNADNSVIEYIKSKINDSEIEDLIMIQIELLYTDPSDKLVSELVSYINELLNKILKEIKLYDLANLITKLKTKKESLKEDNILLEEKNNDIFNKIKTKDLAEYKTENESDNDCAARLIDITQYNTYEINKNKSEINSIGIWINNLDNSFNKITDSVDIEELIINYVNTLGLINRDKFINEYIYTLSNRIDSVLLSGNVLDIITNVMPLLDKMYKDYSSEKNHIYKLLDYYIDLVDMNIKKQINQMEYEERVMLKEKINIICKEILENDNPDDDFKVLVIKSYIRYI